MTIGSRVRNSPVSVLYGLMIVSLVALLPFPPLLQNQATMNLPISANCSAYRISGMWSQICHSSQWGPSGCFAFGVIQRL